MDAFLLLQWLLFGGLALVWMTFCGANLLMLFSERNRSFLPLVGSLAGGLCALVLPDAMASTHRLGLAAVLFFADPYWLSWFSTPLHSARSWLQRR